MIGSNADETLDWRALMHLRPRHDGSRSGFELRTARHAAERRVESPGRLYPVVTRGPRRRDRHFLWQLCRLFILDTTLQAYIVYLGTLNRYQLWKTCYNTPPREPDTPVAIEGQRCTFKHQDSIDRSHDGR